MVPIKVGASEWVWMALVGVGTLAVEQCSTHPSPVTGIRSAITTQGKELEGQPEMVREVWGHPDVGVTVLGHPCFQIGSEPCPPALSWSCLEARVAAP